MHQFLKMLNNDKYLSRVSFPILYRLYSWISIVRIQNFMPAVQKLIWPKSRRESHISAGLTIDEVLIEAMSVPSSSL